MFSCGQQDQPKDTRDPPVVMGQAANPTSGSMQEECRRICATLSRVDQYYWVHSCLSVVSKSISKKAEHLTNPKSPLIHKTLTLPFSYCICMNGLVICIQDAMAPVWGTVFCGGL